MGIVDNGFRGIGISARMKPLGIIAAEELLDL